MNVPDPIERGHIVVDPIERGESRCDDWAAENVRGDMFICSCGNEWPLDKAETLSADPYAIPVCGGCFALAMIEKYGEQPEILRAIHGRRKAGSNEMIERTILICQDCYELKGEMCHNPECVFCRRTMEEVGEYLDVLLIRPVVEGERLSL